MKPPNYAVVIPTVGRDGVAALVRSAAGAPGPRRIVLADDRRSPGAAALALGDVAETAAGVPVTIVRTGGRGPAAARNAGWRAALAADPDLDWIAFVDDDVRLAEDWNAALVRDLADLPATVGASQAQLSVPAPPRRRPTDEERRTTGLVGAPWITADMAYRVEVLATTGGFDERFPRAFREDADLALRSIRAGWSIVWGRRRTVHPLRARGGWWGSLAAQAGNADNALLRAKFGRRWRSLIHTDRGRTGRHGLAVAAAAGTVAGVLTR